MSSYRQSKAKTTKPKDTTSRTKVKQPATNTLINSRSLTRIPNTHKNKKIIPKILSKIQKNVQDLKKYCSDITPNTSRRNDHRQEQPSQTIRTVNEPSQETTASVDQIKKGYLSAYGKETENIIQLWKFYNSSFHRLNKRTSLTAYSMSIPVKSEIVQDYSLESRNNDSGVHSAMSSLNRVPLESINLSDLMTNSNYNNHLNLSRPEDKKSRPEILENVIYQQEQQCRPLQKLRQQNQRPVKSVNFNLHTELDMSIPTQKKNQILKQKSVLVQQKQVSFKECHSIHEQSVLSIKSHHKKLLNAPLIKIDQDSVEEKQLTDKSKSKSKERIQSDMIVELTFKQQQQIPHSNTSEADVQKQPQKVPESQTTILNEKQQYKRIFEKNMLINKRKQQLNAKLKRGGKCGAEQKYERIEAPVIQFGLDEAIIIQEDKPLFANELPLSKQDISLLQKLDQIDKQIAMVQQGDVENCVFQALKGLKKKKNFQKSKFGVAEIPIRRAKKPMIMEFIQPEENIERINTEQSRSSKESKKSFEREKEKSNNSLLDCQIFGLEGEDSLLQNFDGIDIDL